jgi:cytochrome P450
VWSIENEKHQLWHDPPGSASHSTRSVVAGAQAESISHDGETARRGTVGSVAASLFGKVWVATHYDAVNDLLRDHQRFVQNPATARNRWMERIVLWLPGSLKPLATNMLRDPPDHRRLRALVDQAFQRQSIEALRPRLATLADEVLDRLEAERTLLFATTFWRLLREFSPFPTARDPPIHLSTLRIFL